MKKVLNIVLLLLFAVNIVSGQKSAIQRQIKSGRKASSGYYMVKSMTGYEPDKLRKYCSRNNIVLINTKEETQYKYGSLQTVVVEFEFLPKSEYDIVMREKREKQKRLAEAKQRREQEKLTVLAGALFLAAAEVKVIYNLMPKIEGKYYKLNSGYNIVSQSNGEVEVHHEVFVPEGNELKRNEGNVKINVNMNCACSEPKPTISCTNKNNEKVNLTATTGEYINEWDFPLDIYISYKAPCCISDVYVDKKYVSAKIQITEQGGYEIEIK